MHIDTTTTGMSITISGGTAEENNQLCTVVAAALRNSGFRNARLDVACEYPLHTHYDADTLGAMRRLNPDLFDMPICIEGESEDDMRMVMNAMGMGGGSFAFQVEQMGNF